MSRPLNPRKIVTIKIINPKIFWNLEFTYFPKITFLFTIHKSIPATTGSKIQLATCANLMIYIGLRPNDENTTPSNKIRNHTALNCFDFSPDSHPKHPLAT